MITKKIGKVTLNLIDDLEPTFSKDEKELLRIVRDCGNVEYAGIIENSNSYFMLENLSNLRGNIVKWLPICPEDYVLELGAGAGIINHELTKLSDNIYAIEENLTLATILAHRNEECKNAHVYACNIVNGINELLTENTRFNWIFIYDISLLKNARSLLSDSGHIVFISDNRMGMKFLSGNKPLVGDFYDGVEGKAGTGITLPALKREISDAGFIDLSIYYPYPDWRFPKCIFSDKRLPKEGELVNNLMNLDSDRLLMFSEKEAFDASIRDGSFPCYSNSYMAVIGSEIETKYVRFSNDRAMEHSIYTSIDEKTTGAKVVRKHPDSDAAFSHIRKLGEYNKLLNERYLGSGLNINSCVIINESTHPVASFEYVEGKELESLMDDCLLRDDLEGFYKLFDKYVELVGYNNNGIISDIDVVFSNIIVDGDNWTLLDYEWCKEGSIPIKETAYRAIYCYILEDKRREKINLDLIRIKLELSKAATDLIESDEMIFQKRVTGKNKSLSELREALGVKAIDPIPLAKKLHQNNSVYNFKIYPCDSTGNFTEDLAYVFKDAYKSDKLAEVMVPILNSDVRLRVDPLDAPCIVRINECRINELDFPVDNKKRVIANGKRFGENTFVFDSADPNIVFEIEGLINEENSFLFLNIEVIELDIDVAKALCTKQGLFK